MKFQTRLTLPKLLLTALIISAIQVPAAWAVKPGDTAPAWQGVNISDAAEIKFPEILNGRPAVLVFWATWCPYCKAFMPYVKDIQADYADRGVQIITFNTKERGRGDPAAYVESLDFPLIAIADADSIAQDYAVNFIPGLMIVNGEGRVTYRRRSTNLPAGKTVSQQWAEEVRAHLDALLGD